jgi:ZIP family zinc transporter
VPVNVGTVALLACVTALATGLGALPLLTARRPSRSWLARANAAAAGFMVAASIAVFAEGVRLGPWMAVVGALTGIVFLAVVRRLVRQADDVRVGSLRGTSAVAAFLIIAVMTAHSFAEGVGIGVAFGGGSELGVFIAVALAVHNIPEGLAISLVLVPRGASVAAAAAWSVVTSLPQPLLAVPAFLFVEEFSALLPVGLGFAAGAMVGMVVAELIPDARADGSWSEVLVCGGLAFAAMTAIQIALGAL